MKKLPYIFLILMIAATTVSSCRRQSEELSGYFAKLDSLIAHDEDFERDKLLRIAELRRKEANAVSPSDKYMYASLLFDEFETYSSDSAARYINKCIDIAEKENNSEWSAKSKISKIGLLAGTGLLKEAQDVMNTIDTTGFSNNMMIAYYGQLIYLYSHLGNYLGGRNNEYYIRERAYKDSIMDIIPSDHPEYFWFRGWDIIGTSKTDTALIPALVRKLEASKLNSRQDAKEAYMLSLLYDREGNRTESAKWMIISAMVDVMIANAEISSLEEIARNLYAENNSDIGRTYRYLNYSLSKAISYPNRVKAIGITDIFNDVNKAYQDKLHHDRVRTRIWLTVVIILALILALSGVIIVVQNRRLRRESSTLDRANHTLNEKIALLTDTQNRLSELSERLKTVNDELKLKNDELNEANYVKEEYIGYIFTICSNYIRKIEDLRRSIHVKAVTKKYKEIIEETESTDLTRDELKGFYRSFDTIFLHIYPDFVSDFNALLQDDKHITPKDGELLNTELRIYALVRLGITDSIKIAEFLHCSPQTVYNNRFRVRNKAIVPKKDFAEAVRTLGKYMERPS